MYILFMFAGSLQEEVGGTRCATSRVRPPYFKGRWVIAAANLGVADRLFKRHGRWRSDVKDGYIDDSYRAVVEGLKELRIVT